MFFDTITGTAREAFLDIVVGAPSRSAEAIFRATGHKGAADILRSFVTGEGPESFYFGPGSQFSNGLADSETTQLSIQKALKIWKGREGGMYAQNGTITALNLTFNPAKPVITFNPSSPVFIGARAVYATPEAHVIGSFDYEGKIIGRDKVEWTAYNTTSLSSYFAENWHKVDVVINRAQPQAYGNVVQVVKWHTDFNGRRIK